jgi:hypothetical protein
MSSTLAKQMRAESQTAHWDRVGSVALFIAGSLGVTA